MDSLNARVQIIEARLQQITSDCQREAHDIAAVLNDRIFKSELAQCAKMAGTAADAAIKTTIAELQVGDMVEASYHQRLEEALSGIIKRIEAEKDTVDREMQEMRVCMNALEARIVLLEGEQHNHETECHELMAETMQLMPEMPHSPEESVHASPQPPSSPRIQIQPAAAPVVSLSLITEQPYAPDHSVEDIYEYAATSETCVAGSKKENVDSILQLAAHVDDQTLWADVAVAIKTQTGAETAYLFDAGMRLHEIITQLVANIKTDASDENSIFNYIRATAPYKHSNDVYWASFFLAAFALRFMERITKTNVAEKIGHFEHLCCQQEVPASPRPALIPKSPRLSPRSP
jgi:hypothetical protein